MHFLSKIVKGWVYVSIVLVIAVIVFLFGYVFYKGHSAISWEFLTQSPKGAVLGTEGGIFPAIIGSLCFTGMAVLLASIPAVIAALYLVFFCRSKRIYKILSLVIQCISGIPSIVLGLFAYSYLVKELDWGRCILASSCALAIMIFPFIEVRAEKAFREIPKEIILSSKALGCSKTYSILKIVLPVSRGELASAIVLGACFAMGATAPLMFTGAVAYAGIPTSLMEPAMALPMHLYLMVAQGATSMNLAYGTALVMMVILLVSNLLAALYARRRSREWRC